MIKKSRLIIALDVTDKKKAFQIAEELSDLVDAIKVNYPIVLSCGMSIVKELSKYSNVICDFKVADIPNTNSLILRQAFESGASGIIVHGFVGRDSVSVCIDEAKRIGKDVFVVAEMSHPGALEFIQPASDKIALLAKELNATGIIAPGTRPERIKELRKIVGNLLILCPGIGAQGGSAKKAISAGADYIIAGRSIYESEKPRVAAENILKEICGDEK